MKATPSREDAAERMTKNLETTCPWLAKEVEGKVNVQFVEQASYFTDNSENGQPGFIISVWYTDSA